MNKEQFINGIKRTVCEVWKSTIYDDYEVSFFGRVRNATNKNILSNIDRNRTGYLRVYLFKDHKKKRYFIHRLVAEAFLPKKQGKDFVNHKDGNKQNNELGNLEWCNRSENMKHYYKELCGKEYKKTDKTIEKIEKFKVLKDRNKEILNLARKGIKTLELCKMFNLSPRQIRRIKEKTNE